MAAVSSSQVNSRDGLPWWKLPEAIQAAIFSYLPQSNIEEIVALCPKSAKVATKGIELLLNTSGRMLTAPDELVFYQKIAGKEFASSHVTDVSLKAKQPFPFEHFPNLQFLELRGPEASTLLPSLPSQLRSLTYISSEGLSNNQLDVVQERCPHLKNFYFIPVPKGFFIPPPSLLEQAVANFRCPRVYQANQFRITKSLVNNPPPLSHFLSIGRNLARRLCDCPKTKQD